VSQVSAGQPAPGQVLPGVRVDFGESGMRHVRHGAAVSGEVLSRVWLGVAGAVRGFECVPWLNHAVSHGSNPSNASLCRRPTIASQATVPTRLMA
jgi:hypothetical protein